MWRSNYPGETFGKTISGSDELEIQAKEAILNSKVISKVSWDTYTMKNDHAVMKII